MSLLLGLENGELLTWKKGQGDPPSLHNPAGLSELSYRIGRYDSWLELMVHALMEWDVFPLTTSPTEVGNSQTHLSPRLLPMAQRRRIRLNLSEEDNWILGLLRAWSTVGDVLTFYQERLINEGYLRTAQQPLSVHELARLIAYRPTPAVGGVVDLAFGATDVEGLPPRVEIEPGTVVASVPPPGELPQNFETVAALDVRSEWNVLRPPQLDERASPVLRGSSTELTLRGTGLTLDPGDGVLIRGQRGGEEVAYFRRIGDLEAINDERPRTTISWQPPLDPQRPQEEIQKLEAYALRQVSGLFGHRAPLWREQSLAIRRRFRSPLGGVQLLVAATPWRSLNEGLPETLVRCLVQDPGGHLYAGTAGDGVWFRPLGADAWRRGEGGLAHLDVTSLAVDPTAGVLAGTATGGIFRSTDLGARWTELTGRTLGRARWTLVQRSHRLDRLPETPVRSLLAVGKGEGWSLIAGTDSGVYRSTDLANSWQPCNGGLPGTDGTTGETSLVIHALAAAGGRRLYAGTAAGVFESNDLGRRWRPINRGLPGTDPFSGLGSEAILALAFHGDRRRRQDLLLVGTSRGIYRRRGDDGLWKPARDGLLGGDAKVYPTITSLAVLEDPITVTTRLVAGSDVGLWESQDLGDSWQRLELGVTTGVTAIAAGPRAQLVVASPFDGFAVEEWPGFHLSGGHVDLDQLVPIPAFDSWLVLAPDADLEDPPPVGIYRVKGASSVERRAFTLEAAVTRLQVEASPELHRYPLRRTRAYFHSQALSLLPRTQPADPTLALADMRAALREMEAGRPVILTAQRQWDPFALVPLTESRMQAVISEDGDSKADYGSRLTAGVVDGLLSGVTPATSSARAALKVPESLIGAASDPFARPLQVEVAPLSLTLYANVVTASEGRTIHHEVLGDGDGSRILQSFELSEPLAYLRGAPTPLSTLSVRVHDHLWQEVPRLYGEAPDARVYVVELDHGGRATVVFGDGVHGARLPTGRGNIVASYRTGTSDNLVYPGSVRLITSRPLGLEEVTNPLEGTPGSPSEELGSIRLRAPRSVRTLGRIVSLHDYRDFAVGFPGIVKATARQLALAGRQIVHLTVATASLNARPAPGSRLLDELLEAIEAIRCDPQPVHIEAFREVNLEVKGRVRLAPGFFWQDVEPRLQRVLRERFGFQRSRFGDTLSASEAIRVLQGVEGVTLVDLDVFKRLHSPPAPGEREGRVVAGPAIWNGERQKLEAAELVWLRQRAELTQTTGDEDGAEVMVGP